MSFKCDLCNRPMPDGASPTRVIMETRNKSYPERTGKDNKVIDKGGVGWETVREVNACKRCINDMRRAEEERRRDSE